MANLWRFFESNIFSEPRTAGSGPKTTRSTVVDIQSATATNTGEKKIEDRKKKPQDKKFNGLSYYTVNHKNVTFYFLTITLANLNRFL